jgi:hypothetical protein
LIFVNRYDSVIRESHFAIVSLHVLAHIFFRYSIIGYTEVGECAALQHHHLFGMERRDLYCANQVVPAMEKETVDVKGEDVYIG